MCSRFVQILVGTIIGFLYMLLWRIMPDNVYNYLFGPYVGINNWDLITIFSIPILVGITAYWFRRIRWALLSFPMGGLLYIGVCSILKYTCHVI